MIFEKKLYSIFHDVQVKDHDTRIFFLDRSNNRLILSASVLRITLLNLQNTQAVIEGWFWFILLHMFVTKKRSSVT